MNKIHQISIALFFIILFSFTFVASLSKIDESDTAQYIASGRQIAQSGLEHKCVFSYASTDCQIVYSEWLFHLIIYKLFTFGGWNLLSITSCLMFMSIFSLVFWANRKSDWLATYIFLFLTNLTVQLRMILRSEMIGWFLILIQIIIHKSTSSWKTKLVVLFVLQALWANLHGSFPLGIIIALAFVRSRQTFYIFLAMLIASLLNPYGLKAFLWPINFLTNSQWFSFAGEWQGPFTNIPIIHLGVNTFKILLGLSVTTLVLYRKKIKLVDFVLIVIFGYLGVKYLRNIGLFALVATLILPAYWQLKFNNLIKYLAATGLALILVFSSFKIVNGTFNIWDHQDRRFGIGLSELAFYGQGAVDFLVKNKIEGRVFNNYDIGGYLNAFLYPTYQTYIDGHTYTLDLIKEYEKVMSGNISYKQIVEKYGINAFLLGITAEDTAPIIDQLYNDPAWKLVYFDENAVLFVAKTDLSPVDITTCGKLIAVKDPANYSAGYLRQSLFFINQKLWDCAQKVLYSSIKANPNENFYAYALLALTQIQNNQLGFAVQNLNKSLAIRDDFYYSHYLMGIVAENQGQFALARQSYQKALSLRPNFPSAIQALSRLNNLL